MQILNTNSLKNELIDKLKAHNFTNKILILSKNPTAEVDSYKNFIIKRCEEFEIPYEDKTFNENSTTTEVLDFINSHDKEDGFIILLPFPDADLDLLRAEIAIKDPDGFTYKSMGLAMDEKMTYLPATPFAIALFLKKNFDLKGKNIVIANSTKLVGLPLAAYLSRQRATVTVINQLTANSRELIKASDIFISAIGKAEYYDKTYFKDGQILIDVGTSTVNGKIKGDINFSDLEDLDVKILTHKEGIGQLTTLTLLAGLI